MGSIMVSSAGCWQSTVNLKVLVGTAFHRASATHRAKGKFRELCCFLRRKATLLPPPECKGSRPFKVSRISEALAAAKQRPRCHHLRPDSTNQGKTEGFYCLNTAADSVRAPLISTSPLHVAGAHQNIQIIKWVMHIYIHTHPTYLPTSLHACVQKTYLSIYIYIHLYLYLYLFINIFNNILFIYLYSYTYDTCLYKHTGVCMHIHTCIWSPPPLDPRPLCATF